MRYKVYVPELHYQVVQVEASSEQEAFEKAQDALEEGDSLELEYSHTIEDMDQWKVEEVEQSTGNT